MSEKTRFLDNSASSHESDRYIQVFETIKNDVSELRKLAEVQILSTLSCEIDNLLGAETSASFQSFRETTMDDGTTGLIASTGSAGMSQYRVVRERSIKPEGGERVISQSFYAWDANEPGNKEKQKIWVQRVKAKNPSLDRERQGFIPSDFKEISKIIKSFKQNQ